MNHWHTDLYELDDAPGNRAARELSAEMHRQLLEKGKLQLSLRQFTLSERKIINKDLGIFQMAVYYSALARYLRLAGSAPKAVYDGKRKVETLLSHVTAACNLMADDEVQNRLCAGYSRFEGRASSPLALSSVKADSYEFPNSTSDLNDDIDYEGLFRKCGKNPNVVANVLEGFKDVLKLSASRAADLRAPLHDSIVALPFAAYWKFASGKTPSIYRGNGGHSAFLQFLVRCFDLVGDATTADGLMGLNKQLLNIGIDNCHKTISENAIALRAGRTRLPIRKCSKEIRGWV